MKLSVHTLVAFAKPQLVPIAALRGIGTFDVLWDFCEGKIGALCTPNAPKLLLLFRLPRESGDVKNEVQKSLKTGSQNHFYILDLLWFPVNRKRWGHWNLRTMEPDLQLPLAHSTPGAKVQAMGQS